MSCNGCRVLRKGCSEACILRSSLQWIDTPEAQGNATLFLAKFFGRSDLLSFISAVPDPQRSALFQSLLFEACGRAVNPVDGAVGLLSSGNWHVCQAAVETVLAGGTLMPITGPAAASSVHGGAARDQSNPLIKQQVPDGDGVSGKRGRGWASTVSFHYSEESNFHQRNKRRNHQDKKLLNLFV